MSQSSYISRRASSRLGDYIEAMNVSEDTHSGATMSTYSESTSTYSDTSHLLSPSSRTKVQELASTNDLLAERMSLSSLQQVPIVTVDTFPFMLQ